MSTMPRVFALLSLARAAAIAFTIVAPAISVAHAGDDRNDDRTFIELLHERKLRAMEAQLEQQRGVHSPLPTKQSDARPAASALPAA